MPTENARPQDASRSPGRRAKGRPSAESRALLARYQKAMRSELEMLLVEIRPYPRHRLPRPPLAERAKLWELAIRLGKELGSEIDVATPTDDKADSGAPATLRAVDF